MGATKRRRAATAPERGGAAAAEHYGASEAARYDACNAATQAELAMSCTALLAAGDRALVLDAGCGTGLSAAAAGAALGVDVSPAMLDAAAARGVEVCRLDLGHGVAARRRAFDAAVSVSAAQWCRGERAARLYRSLADALRRPGGSAALQVYVDGAAQAAELLAAARAAFGGEAALVVDVPHGTPARKLFVCARHADAGVAPPEPPPCAVAWPRDACCAAWWRHRVGRAADEPAFSERLRREHVRLGRRLTRALRRAEALAPPQAWPRAAAEPGSTRHIAEHWLSGGTPCAEDCLLTVVAACEADAAAVAAGVPAGPVSLRLESSGTARAPPVQAGGGSRGADAEPRLDAVVGPLASPARGVLRVPAAGAHAVLAARAPADPDGAAAVLSSLLRAFWDAGRPVGAAEVSLLGGAAGTSCAVIATGAWELPRDGPLSAALERVVAA